MKQYKCCECEKIAVGVIALNHQGTPTKPVDTPNVYVWPVCVEHRDAAITENSSAHYVEGVEDSVAGFIAYVQESGARDQMIFSEKGPIALPTL